MTKNTCENCRYYLPYTDTRGYCGNSRVLKTTTNAARACGHYEPDKFQIGKNGGTTPLGKC